MNTDSWNIKRKQIEVAASRTFPQHLRQEVAEEALSQAAELITKWQCDGSGRGPECVKTKFVISNARRKVRRVRSLTVLIEPDELESIDRSCADGLRNSASPEDVDKLIRLVRRMAIDDLYRVVDQAVPEDAEYFDREYTNGELLEAGRRVESSDRTVQNNTKSKRTERAMNRAKFALRSLLATAIIFFAARANASLQNRDCTNDSLQYSSNQLEHIAELD